MKLFEIKYITPSAHIEKNHVIAEDIHIAIVKCENKHIIKDKDNHKKYRFLRAETISENPIT